MTVEVLVLEAQADAYKTRLVERFPSLVIHCAQIAADAPADLASIDVLMAFGVAIDDALMKRLSGLRWVQSLATGVDHFLACPSLKPATILTSGRGIHGAPMRETVAYLMLSVARNSMRLHRNQVAHDWSRQSWPLLAGKTAVLVGVGVSGTAIAQLLRAFGMTVVGVTHTPRAVEGFDEVVASNRLVEMAARADYLVNVLPGGPGNRNRIGASVFAAMKSTARFINVGRGETVDEAALIGALKSGRIAGAGLDVFHYEPLPADSQVWDLPNVTVTPHIAGYFDEYMDHVLPIVIENMDQFLAGHYAEMRNVVSRR